jgi:hypothetical protein
VFEDLNRNGDQDWAPQEDGIPGVLVILSGELGATQVLTTHVNGGYRFIGLTGGETYTVTEVDPVGHFSTTPNVVTRTVPEYPAPGPVVNFGDHRLFMAFLPVILRQAAPW